MKKFITTSILAFGVSGAMLLVPGTMAAQATQTQGSQATTTNDTQMAAKVRQGLMQDQNVGTAAHNVRVSSKNGMVTLRGKVSTESEKDAIVARAKSIAGETNVKDEITVAKSK
jgi:hyperosmotically inducible protein